MDEISVPMKTVRMLRDAGLATGLTIGMVAFGGVVVVIGVSIYLGAVAHFDRRPVIIAPSGADLPSITFERSLPALRFAPELAWTADSTLLISSAPAKPGFRVETIEGDVVEEHSVPYVQIYHEILSTHEVITQTLLRDVSFQAVDLRDGRVLLQGDNPLPRNPDGIIAIPRFSTNGDRSVVAVGFGPPRSNEPVTFYDTATWRPLRALAFPSPGPGKFWSMRLSNDGTRLAYNAEDAVAVVDVPSGAILGRFPLQSGDTFAFSPDGSMLAVAERGSAEGHASKRWIAIAVHVFRLSDGVEVARREQPRDASVTSLVWDPGGRFLAYLDGETVHLWKPTAKEASDVTIRIKSEIVGGMAISPDGNRLAVGDGYAIDVFRIGS